MARLIDAVLNVLQRLRIKPRVRFLRLNCELKGAKSSFVLLCLGFLDEVGIHHVALVFFASDGDLKVLGGYTDMDRVDLRLGLVQLQHRHPARPADLPAVDLRRPDYVSATIDSSGRAILTWVDAEWNDFIYYAALGSDGSIYCGGEDQRIHKLVDAGASATEAWSWPTGRG